MSEQQQKLLGLIDEATAHAQLSRTEHVAVQQAIKFIEAELIQLEILRKKDVPTDTLPAS